MSPMPVQRNVLALCPYNHPVEHLRVQYIPAGVRIDFFCSFCPAQYTTLLPASVSPCQCEGPEDATPVLPIEG